MHPPKAAEEKACQKRPRGGTTRTPAERERPLCPAGHKRRRGWTTREKKLEAKLRGRRTYLRRRVGELKQKMEKTDELMIKLQTGLSGDITELLHVDDEASGGAPRRAETTGAGATAARADARALPVSEAQSNRLRSQATATLDFLIEEHARDQLQLQNMEDALRAANSVDPNNPDTLKDIDARVFALMDQASTARSRSPVAAIAASVATTPDAKYGTGTVLSWVREFRKLDGHLKRDCRGVYERPSFVESPSIPPKEGPS